MLLTIYFRIFQAARQRLRKRGPAASTTAAASAATANDATARTGKVSFKNAKSGTTVILSLPKRALAATASSIGSEASDNNEAEDDSTIMGSDQSPVKRMPAASSSHRLLLSPVNNASSSSLLVPDLKVDDKTKYVRSGTMPETERCRGVYFSWKCLGDNNTGFIPLASGKLKFPLSPLGNYWANPVRKSATLPRGLSSC